MEEPKAEIVLKYIFDLYDNPDVLAKEQASEWLNNFQKSVNNLFTFLFYLFLLILKRTIMFLQIYSWKISDQLLQQKNDLNSCYFAAQTMRSKIQHSFHELPEVNFN